VRDGDNFFQNLKEFVKELNNEDQRTIREDLSEEELALFDLLTKPKIKLRKKELDDVKKIAKDLLKTLKEGKRSFSTGGKRCKGYGQTLH
jgi:type I restriction enzyme, R subunit